MLDGFPELDLGLDGILQVEKFREVGHFHSKGFLSLVNYSSGFLHLLNISFELLHVLDILEDHVSVPNVLFVWLLICLVNQLVNVVLVELILFREQLLSCWQRNSFELFKLFQEIQ